MSALTDPDRGQLDSQEQLVRIRRQQAETEKFAAEQSKLAAEAAKFNREPRLLMLVALMGSALTHLGDLIHRLGGSH